MRRGALCRRPLVPGAAQLLEDCWADGAALDRGVLDDGVARKVEVLVTCESDDGGVEDCALLAASAAIASLENTPLVLHAAPLTCAVTEDGAVLADPSIDEASGCARAPSSSASTALQNDFGRAAAEGECEWRHARGGAIERSVALAAKRAATIRAAPRSGRLNYLLWIHPPVAPLAERRAEGVAAVLEDDAAHVRRQRFAFCIAAEAPRGRGA